MEFIPENPILEFKEDTLNLLRKQCNFENATDMNCAIDVLAAWIKKQNHFIRKEFPRDYLERIIIANKGSIEKTKIKLDKICTYRTLMPHFFGENLSKNNFEDLENLTWVLPEVNQQCAAPEDYDGVLNFKVCRQPQTSIETSVSVFLPKPTQDNYRVCLIKSKAKNFTTQQLLNLYRYALLLSEYKNAHDYSNGLVICIDYTETNLIELIKNLDLVELRRVITIITEGYGIRLQGIHLLTQSKTIEVLVTIIKQLVSTKIGSRIYVHKNMDTVYQYIPMDMFPSEYGGKEKSIYKLRNELLNVVTSKDFRKYMDEMNEAKTDESCRQIDKFNDQYMGTPGSFRSLTTD